MDPIPGARPMSSIVFYCLLILRQSRLLPAGLMTIISNVALENINQWIFENNFARLDGKGRNNRASSSFW